MSSVLPYRAGLGGMAWAGGRGGGGFGGGGGGLGPGGGGVGGCPGDDCGLMPLDACDPYQGCSPLEADAVACVTGSVGGLPSACAGMSPEFPPQGTFWSVSSPCTTEPQWPPET
jgi:hypothetical protein